MSVQNIHYPVINHHGKKYEKEYTHTHAHIYISESLCHTAETNAVL